MVQTQIKLSYMYDMEGRTNAERGVLIAGQAPLRNPIPGSAVDGGMQGACPAGENAWGNPTLSQPRPRIGASTLSQLSVREYLVSTKTIAEFIYCKKKLQATIMSKGHARLALAKDTFEKKERERREESHTSIHRAHLYILWNSRATKFE